MAQAADDSKFAVEELRVVRHERPATALGLAVNHLMTKPAFARLKFGDFSRGLAGQIERKHYCFVVDRENRIQGFLAWAITSREDAEAWIEGRSDLFLRRQHGRRLHRHQCLDGNLAEGEPRPD